MAGVTESVVEPDALVWFESVGWSVRHGAEIALRISGDELRVQDAERFVREMV